MVLILINRNSYAFLNLDSQYDQKKEIQQRYSNTKILYTAIKDNKRKVAVMDFNGKNLKYLTNGENLVMTSTFSRENKDEIFFLEYLDNLAEIQKMDIFTRQQERVGDFEDLILMPNFYSSDENILLFSAIKYNVANIYKLNLNNNELTKLTFNKSKDITPFFSPNGQEIVFCSDRSGTKKLYIMDRDGNNIEKISKNRGDYSNPVWSPNGELIAFVKFYQDKFYIGIMNRNGEAEKDLVSAYSFGNLRWSPDGKYLMYSKQNKFLGRAGKSYIYIINIANKKEFRIPTPLGEEAINPDWI